MRNGIFELNCLLNTKNFTLGENRDSVIRTHLNALLNHLVPWKLTTCLEYESNSKHWAVQPKFAFKAITSTFSGEVIV